MTDPQDPKPDPKRPAAPGQPLPRLWKAQPDPVPAETGSQAKDKKRSRKSSDKDRAESKKNVDPDAPKKILKEDTPEFDTQETRQRVRIILGVAMLGFVFVAGYNLLSLLGPSVPMADDAAPSDVAEAAGPVQSTPVDVEAEARLLYQRASDVAKNGKPELALVILNRVTTSYPGTKTALEAKAALKQHARNFLAPEHVPSTAPGTAGVPTPTAAPSTTTIIGTTNPVPVVAPIAQVKPALSTAPPPESLPPPVVAAPSIPPRTLPKGFRIHENAKVHESGWPLEIIGDHDDAIMVLVPGGTFLQGRDDASPAEAPAHRVILGTYYVDRHEVTLRQFQRFQRETGRRPDWARAWAKEPSLANAKDADDRPVVLVSARDASDYASWAGKRLPTEAQWEAAGRSTDGRLFPWRIEEHAWTRPREPRQIDPVEAFPSDVSPYGAYDLAGNAWEWTKDWYDPNYYQLFKNTPADSPTGPSSRPKSQYLVVKGTAKDWSLTRRDGIRHDARLPYLGFRCVLPVEGPGNVFEASAPSSSKPPASGGNGPVVPF